MWQGCQPYAPAAFTSHTPLPLPVRGWHHQKSIPRPYGLERSASTAATPRACNRNEYQGYFLGLKAAGASGWQPCYLHVPIVIKSGSVSLLELSGPVKACNGIALPLPLHYVWHVSNIQAIIFRKILHPVLWYFFIIEAMWSVPRSAWYLTFRNRASYI
jgi:hypothetical protein